MFSLRAPAKINLYLNVVGKRNDGFHEIETVFERIDLADELTFQSHPDEIQIVCSDPNLSCGPDNLIYKAAILLKKASRINKGASIHLNKRIPIAAGLGGGSSDAAATLLGLNKLWSLALSRSDLVRIGAKLGSDVCFFLQDKPYAVGSGRGEQCKALDTSHKLTHILVVPEERLSTKEIYDGLDLRLTGKAPSINIISHALCNGSLSELAEGLWNDLEPEANRRCPTIKKIQSLLQHLGCVGVSLSGSGSSVYGLCSDPAQAEEIFTNLQIKANPSWRIEIVQTDLAVRVITPA